MNHTEPTALSTHLLLPSWWVRAYEAAVLADAGGADAMTQACSAGLAPALTAAELNALASVLASMQAQLFEHGPAAVKVHAGEHRKNSGSVTRSRCFVFDKLAQMLAGLRLLAVEGEGDTQGWRAQAPFAGDRWRRADDGELELSFDLAPLGAEILFGLADAHVDLARFARGEPEAADVLGASPPLAVWRSLWLELAGTEQLLALRLERGMQWEFRWLQLEGIFGMPLAELFRGLKPQAGTADKSGLGELAARLKVLARFGKKLAAHGFLAPQVADQYLAVDARDEGGLSLVWQVARERLAVDADAAYRERVAAFMQRWRQPEALDALARLYAGADAVPQAQQIADALAQAPLPAAIAGLQARPVQLLSPVALFLECTLRQRPGARWPLPAALQASPLAAVARAGAGVEERAAAFCRMLDEEQELRTAMRDLPFATLASAATRADQRFSVAVSDAASGLDLGKPRLVYESPQQTPPAPAPRPARSGAVTGAMTSRMLKLASEELAKMRANHPERFRDLQQAYLAGLDEAGRKLLLDVQRRIQPGMFEEQLRQRLVRYMVDNPGAWRSPTPSKALT